MKTTLAAGLFAAASAVELDPLAVPDFIAGFMFGLTGDNHLAEIEKCYSGGDVLVTDAQSALADIKAGHIIQGAKDFGKIIWDLPDALADCQNIDTDLQKIEDWASVFKHPLSLTKEVTNNWLFHGVKVKEDIAAEQQDWDSGDYFDAGKETAAAIELLIPFNEAQEQVELNIKGDAEFVAGFLYGMVGDNHLDEIKSCYTGTAPLRELVDSFVKHMEHLNFFAAIEDFEEFMKSVSYCAEPCRIENLKDDIASIKAWMAQFERIPSLI